MNSQSRRLKPWLRAVAIVTAIAVTTTSVADANQLNLPSPKHAVIDSIPQVSADFFDSIEIPSSIGTVRRIHRGSRSEVIVHIQDAHVNEEAQRNIGKIIQYFSKNKGLNLVNLEGGTGELPTELFSFFPDKDVRKEVSDYYLQEGRLSGAEYLAVVEEPMIKLNGIEDATLYQENKKAYLDALSFKERDEKVLHGLDEILKKVSRHVYSKELYDLTLQRREFQEDGKNLLSYARYLINLANQHVLATTDYQGIHNVILIMDLEKEIDFEKAEAEVTSLGDDLKRMLPVEEMTRYLAHSLQYDSKKMSRRDYYRYLEMQLENLSEMPQGDSLKPNYTNLLKYLRYIQLYDTINIEVFDEIENLENSLKSKLFQTEEEKQLDTLIRAHLILEKMFDFSLTKQDADYFYAHRDHFQSAYFKSILEPFLVKYHFSEGLPNDLSVLDQDLPGIEKFYQVAIKRDDVLIQNTIEKMASEEANISAMITGGFHTAGIERYLTEQDYSYIVIAPSISGGIDSEKEAARYQSALSGKPLPIEQALALALPSSQSGRVNDPRFQLAVELLLNIDMALGVKSFDNNPSAKAYWTMLAVAKAVKLRSLDEATAAITEALNNVTVQEERSLLETLIEQLLNGKYIETISQKDSTSRIQQIYLQNGEKYTVLEITPADTEVSEIAQIAGRKGLIDSFVYGEHKVAIYQVDATVVDQKFSEKQTPVVSTPIASVIETEAITSLKDLFASLEKLSVDNVDEQLSLAKRIDLEALENEIQKVRVRTLPALVEKLDAIKKAKARYGNLSERLDLLISLIVKRSIDESKSVIAEATRRWKKDKSDVRPLLQGPIDLLDRMLPFVSVQQRAELRAVRDDAQTTRDAANQFFLGLAREAATEKTPDITESVPAEKIVTSQTEVSPAAVSVQLTEVRSFQDVVSNTFEDFRDWWNRTFGDASKARKSPRFRASFELLEPRLTLSADEISFAGPSAAIQFEENTAVVPAEVWVPSVVSESVQVASAGPVAAVSVTPYGVDAAMSGMIATELPIGTEVVEGSTIVLKKAADGSPITTLQQLKYGDGRDGFQLIIKDEMGYDFVTVRQGLQEEQRLHINDPAYGGLDINQEKETLRFGIFNEADELIGVVVIENFNSENPTVTMFFKGGGGGVSSAGMGPIASSQGGGGVFSPGSTLGGSGSSPSGFVPFGSLSFDFVSYAEKADQTEYIIAQYEFNIPNDTVSTFYSVQMIRKGNKLLFKHKSDVLLEYDLQPEETLNLKKDVVFELTAEGLKIEILDPEGNVKISEIINYSRFQEKTEELSESESASFRNRSITLSFGNGIEVEVVIVEQKSGDNWVVVYQKAIVRVKGKEIAVVFLDPNQVITEASLEAIVDFDAVTGKITIMETLDGVNQAIDTSKADSMPALPTAKGVDAVMGQGEATLPGDDKIYQAIEEMTAEPSARHELRAKDSFNRRVFLGRSAATALVSMFAGVMGTSGQVAAQVSSSDSSISELLSRFNQTSLPDVAPLTEKEVVDTAKSMIGQEFKIEYIHHSTEEDLARMIPEAIERQSLIDTAARMMNDLGFPVPTSETLPENDTMTAIDWATQFLAPVILELDIRPKDREEFLKGFERAIPATIAGLNFEKSLNQEKLFGMVVHAEKMGYSVAGLIDEEGNPSADWQADVSTKPIQNFTEDSQVKEMYRPMVGNIAILNWVQLNKRWKALGMAEKTGLKMNLDTLLGVALNFSMQKEPSRFFESIYLTGNHQLFKSPEVMRLVSIILKIQGRRINGGLFSLASSDYAWREGNLFKGKYNLRVEQISHWLRGVGEAEKRTIFEYLEGVDDSRFSDGVSPLNLANGIGLAILQLSALWKQKIIDSKTGRGPQSGAEVVNTDDFDIFALVDWFLGYLNNPEVLPSAFQDLYSDSYDPTIKKIWTQLNEGSLPLDTFDPKIVFDIVLDSDGKGPSKLSPDQQWDIHRLRKIAEGLGNSPSTYDRRYFRSEVLKVIIGHEMGRSMTWIRFGLEEGLIQLKRDAKTQKITPDMTAFDNRLRLMKQIKPYVEGFVGKSLNLNYTEDMGLLSGMAENVDRYLKPYRQAKKAASDLDLRVRYLAQTPGIPSKLIEQAKKQLADAWALANEARKVIDLFPKVFSFILMTASKRRGIQMASEVSIAHYKKTSPELRSPAFTEQFEQAQRLIEATRFLPKTSPLFTLQEDVQEILALLGEDRPFNLLDLESGSDMIGFLISWTVGRLAQGWDGSIEQAALLKQTLEGVTNENGSIVSDPQARMAIIVKEVNAYYKELSAALRLEFPIIPNDFKSMTMDQKGQVMSFLIEADKGWTPQIERSHFLIAKYFGKYKTESGKQDLDKVLKEATDYYRALYSGGFWAHRNEGLTFENIRTNRKARGDFLAYLLLKYDAEPSSAKREFQRGRSELRTTPSEEIERPRGVSRRLFVQLVAAGGAGLAASSVGEVLGQEPQVSPEGTVIPQTSLSVPSFESAGERVGPRPQLYLAQLDQIDAPGISNPTPFRALGNPLNTTDVAAQVLEGMKEIYANPALRKDHLWNSFLLYHAVKGETILGEFDLATEAGREALRQQFLNNAASPYYWNEIEKKIQETDFRGFFQVWAKVRVEEGLAQSQNLMNAIAVTLFDPEKKQELLAEVQMMTDFREGVGARRINEKSLASNADIQGLVIGWIQFRMGFYTQDINQSWQETAGVANDLIKTIESIQEDDTARDLFNKTIGKMYFLDQGYAASEAEAKAEAEVKEFAFFTKKDNKEAMEFMLSMTAMLVVDFRKNTIKAEDSLTQPARIAHHTANFWQVMVHQSANVQAFYNGINRGGTALDLTSTDRRNRRSAYGEFAAIARMMEDIHSRFDLTEDELKEGMAKLIEVQATALRVWKRLEDSEIAYYYRLFYLGRRNGEMLEGERTKTFSQIVSIEDFFSMIQSLIDMRKEAGATLLAVERKKIGRAPEWLGNAGQKSLIGFIEDSADPANKTGLKDVPILAEEAISRVIQTLVQQKEMPENERKSPAEIKAIAERIMEAELYLQAVYMTYHHDAQGAPVRMPRGDLSPYLDEVEAALLKYPGTDVYLEVRDRIARIFKYEGMFASKVSKELFDRTVMMIESISGQTFVNKQGLKDKIFHVRKSASFGKASYIVKLQDKGRLKMRDQVVEQFLKHWIWDVAAIEAVSYLHNDGFVLPFISVDSAVEQFRNGEKKLVLENDIAEEDKMLVDEYGNDHNGGLNRVLDKFKTLVKDGHDLGYKNLGKGLNQKRFFRDVYFGIYRSIPNEDDEAWWLGKWKALENELRQSGEYTQGEIEMFQQDFVGGMFTARNQFLEIIGQPLLSQNSDLTKIEETYAEQIKRYEEVVAEALIRNLARSRGRAEKIAILHEKIQALERVFQPAMDKINERRAARIEKYKGELNDATTRVETANKIMEALRVELESLGKDPNAFSLSTDKVSYLIGKMQEMGYTIESALLRVVILPEVLGTSIFKEVFPEFVIEGGKIAAMTEPIFRSYGITDPELQAEVESGLRIEVDRLRKIIGNDPAAELSTVWDVIEDSLDQLKKRLELTREVQKLLAGNEAVTMQSFGLSSRIASDTLAGGLDASDLQDAELVVREVFAIGKDLGITLSMRKVRFLTDLILKHGVADLDVTPPFNEQESQALKQKLEDVFDEIFDGEPQRFYEAPSVRSTIARAMLQKPGFKETAKEEMLRAALAKRIHPADIQKLFDDATEKFSEINQAIEEEKNSGIYDENFQNIVGDGVDFWDVLVYLDMNQSDAKKQIGVEQILFSHRDGNNVEQQGMSGFDHLRFLQKVSTAYIKVFRRAQQEYLTRGQPKTDLSLYKVFSWAAALTLLTSLFKLRELRDESKHVIPKIAPEAKEGWASVTSSLLNIFTYNALADFWRNFLLLGFASTLFYTANTSFLPVIGVVLLLSHFLYYITPRGVLNVLVVYSHIVAMASALFLAFNLSAFGFTAVLTYLTALLNYPIVLIVLVLHVALLVTTSPWFQKKFGDGHSGVFESEAILEEVTSLGEGKYTERNPLAYNPRKDKAVKFLEKKHAEIRPWLPDFSGTYEDFQDKLREVMQGQFRSFNGNMDVNFKAALILNGGLFNHEEVTDPNDPSKTIFRVKDLDAKAADFKKETDASKKSMTYRQLYQAIQDMRISVLNEAMDAAEKADKVTFSDDERAEALTYFKDADGKNTPWENNMLVIVTPGARKPYHLMRWLRWLAWGEDGTEGKTFGELEYKYRTDLYKQAIAVGETPSKEAWNPNDFKPWKFTLLGHTFHFGIPALARRKALEAGGEEEKNYWISPTIFLTPFFAGIVSSTTSGEAKFVPWDEAQNMDAIKDFVNVVPGEATYEATGYTDDNNSFFPAMGLYLLKIIETTTIPFMLFQGSISYFMPFLGQGAVSLYSFSGWIAHGGGWFHQTANAMIAASTRPFGKYWGKIVDLLKLFSPTKIFVLGAYTWGILMPSGAGIRALNTAINALKKGESLRQKQVDQSMDKVTNSFNSEDEQTGAKSTDQESTWAWMRANWKKYKDAPDSPLKKWIYSDAPFDPITAEPLSEFNDFVAAQELPSFRRQANVLVQAPRSLWYLIMDDREASGVGDFFKAFKWIANDGYSQYLEHVKVFARVVHTKFFAKMVTFSYFSNIVFAAYLLVFTGFGLGAGFIMIMYVMAAWAYTAMIMSALILVKFVSVMFQRAAQMPDFKMNGKLYRVEGAFGFLVGALNGVAAATLTYITAIAYTVFFGVTVSVPFVWVVGVFTAIGIVVGVLPVPSARKNENLFNVVKALKQFALMPVSVAYSFFTDAIQMLGELVLSGPVYMTNLVTDIKPKLDQYVATRRAIYYGEVPPVNAPPNVPEVETNAIWKYRHLVTTSAVGLSLLMPFLGYKVFVLSPIILAVLGLVLGSYGTYLHFSKAMYANLLNTTLQRVEAAQAVEVSSLQKLGVSKYLPQYWDLMARVALGSVLSKTKNWFFQSSILFVMSVVSYPLGFLRDIRDYNRVKKTGVKPNMVLKNRDWVLADFGRMFVVSMFPIVALPLAGLFAPLLMKPFVFNVVLLGSTILIPFAVSMFSHFFVGYHFGQRLTPIIHWSIGGLSLAVGVALHLPGLQMYFGPIVELFRNMLFAASSTVSGIGTSSVVNGFGISMSVDSRYVIYNAVLLAGQLGITIAAVLLALKHTVFNVLLSRKASKEDKREGLIFLTVFSTAVFVLGAAIAELNRREIATDSSAQVSTEIIDKIKTTESKVAAPISWDWVQLGKSSLSPEMETKRLAYIAGMTDYLQPGKGLKEIKYMDSDDDEKTVFVVLDRLSDDLRPLSPMQTQPLTDGIYANLLTRHRDLSILENYLAYLEHQQNVYGVPTWMDVVGNKVQPSTRVTVGIEDLTGYVAQLWLAKLNLEVRLSQTTDVASNNQITRSIGRLEKLIESNQSTFQALVDPEKGLLYRELVVRTGKPDPTKGHKDRMAVEDLYAIMILSAVYDLPDTVWKNAPLEVQNYTDSNGKTYPVLAPYNGEAFIGGMNATFWPSDQLKSLFANTGLYFLDQAKQGKSAFPSPAYVGRDYMNAGGTIAEVPSSRNDLNVPNAQAMYSGVPTVFEEFTQKHPTPRVFLDTNDQSGASATLVLPAAAALLNIEKPDYSGVSPETAEVLKGANDQYDVLEAEAIKKSAEPKETAPKKEASAPKAPRSELRESLTDVDALSAALETKTEFTFDQTRQSVLASQQEFKKLEVTLEDALRDHRTAMIRALGLNSAIVSGRGETLIRYREGVDSDAYLANMIQLLALRNVKVVIFTDDDDQAERLRIALSKLKAPNLSIKLLTELADYLDKKREEYNLDQALQIVTDARLYKDQRELIETVLTTTAVELSQNNLILLGWDEQVQGIRPFTPFNKFLDKIVQTLKAEMKISQSA